MKRKNIYYIGTTLAVCYLLAILAIWIDGATSHYQASHYAVVLGNKVYLSGEPSQRLQARLSRALLLYQRGVVKQIIVSGGVGKEGHDEAIVMRAFLVNKGVKPANVIADSNGYTTRLTAQNTAHLITGKQSNPLLLSHNFIIYHGLKWLLDRLVLRKLEQPTLLILSGEIFMPRYERLLHG